MRTRGFTLIETVLVVGLVAIALTFAVALIDAGLPGQQLRSSARELAAQLRFARAQAVATGSQTVFQIDTRSRAWQGPKRHSGTIPGAIAIEATVASSERPEPQIAAIRFFPEGAATGGRIVLRHDRAAWQIDVDWLTGEVRLSRADGP
jgi:general secretion pathway protein H